MPIRIHPHQVRLGERFKHAKVQAKLKAKECIRTPRMQLQFTWALTLFFSLCYTVAAIVATYYNNGSEPTDSKTMSFAAIVNLILVLVLVIGGTCMMRRWQNPLALGVFIGYIVVMSVQMMVLGVLFANEGIRSRKMRKDGLPNTNIHSNEGVATFSIFMFVIYAVFTAMLVRYRQVVLDGELLCKGNPKVKLAPQMHLISPSQQSNATGKHRPSATPAPTALSETTGPPTTATNSTPVNPLPPVTTSVPIVTASSSSSRALKTDSTPIVTSASASVSIMSSTTSPLVNL